MDDYFGSLPKFPEVSKKRKFRKRKIVLDYVQIKAKLEDEGKRLDEFDLLIAATAKISNLKLLTQNKKHFQRIPGLK